ncbi:hypothetical protein [Chitinophaga alhagiae]|uniref:hypothetical protein n=1 Tax=Chitinophaga alhagiae TaxID=2203219 RepID=UPI000E5BF59B|nr:hypothetical protein [Chitinophaga alhagiae]
MAKKKQRGILQLTGPTQNMIIYRKRNGEFGFRKKGGVTAERMATDPNYEAARLNAKDFGQACKAAVLIKRAFAAMVPRQANSNLFQRLTGLCKAVIKSDLAHKRGSRRLPDGDTRLFHDFEFTPAGSFSNTMPVPFLHRVDRAAGTVSLEWPAYIPGEVVLAPEKATHYRLKLGAAVLHFENGKHTVSFTRSADMPLNVTPAVPQTLSVKIPVNTADPVFVALAIEFMEEEGHVRYPIRDSRFCLMKLAAVDVAGA